MNFILHLFLTLIAMLHLRHGWTDIFTQLLNDQLNKHFLLAVESWTSSNFKEEDPKYPLEKWDASRDHNSKYFLKHPCRIYRPFFLNYRPFLKVAEIHIQLQMTLCTQIKFLMKQNLWIHASPSQKCQFNLFLEFLGGLLWENSDKLWMLISSNISFY